MPTILSRRSGGTNGGGESDAAFTPSPPVPGLGDALSKTLAHQTKIRNLYSTPVRPDSSSSASSATDWEGQCLKNLKQIVGIISTKYEPLVAFYPIVDHV